MLSNETMSDSCLCSAQGARGCSWMGCSPMDPRAMPAPAARRMLVDARGWGDPPWTHGRFLPVQQRTGCQLMLVDGVRSNGPCSPMGPLEILTCAAHRMLVYARGYDAAPWTPARKLPVQRTGRQWMLMDGVLSHRPLSETYLCSAQDARGCAWMGRHPMNPCAVPACAAHRMHVDAREWMGVPPHWHMSESYLRSGAQDASGSSWVVCSPMGPGTIAT